MRNVIIAAGIGAFSPRRLPQAAAEPWYGRGIDDRVGALDVYAGKHVVIIGGGPSGLSSAIRIKQLAEQAGKDVGVGLSLRGAVAVGQAVAEGEDHPPAAKRGELDRLPARTVELEVGRPGNHPLGCLARRRAT